MSKAQPEQLPCVSYVKDTTWTITMGQLCQRHNLNNYHGSVMSKAQAEQLPWVSYIKGTTWTITMRQLYQRHKLNNYHGSVMSKAQAEQLPCVSYVKGTTWTITIDVFFPCVYFHSYTYISTYFRSGKVLECLH